MSKTWIFPAAIGLVAAALLASPARAGVAPLENLPPAPAGVNVTINEFTDGIDGHYDVAISNSGWQLLWFAVENNSAVSTDTQRPGWSSSIVGEEVWDAGAGFGLGSGQVIDTNLSFANVDFADIFGNDALQAVVYWWFDGGSGTPLGPNASDDRFDWFGCCLASEFIGVVSDNVSDPQSYAQLSGHTIPEPASAALIGLALAALGFARRRR